MPDWIEQSGKTLGDLMLDLAEDVGVARFVDDQGNAIDSALPTDPALLSKLRRKVNDGYKSFLAGIDPADEPLPPYTRWRFLEREVEISLSGDGTGPQNINGDSSRYRLPGGITSGPITAWTMDNGGRWSNVMIEDTSCERVQAWLSTVNVQNGCPQISACRALDNPDGPAGGAAWEVIVAPRPGEGVTTMRATFRLHARKLTDQNEKHLAGAQHDQTIRLFALCEWIRMDDPTGAMERVIRQASAALRSSIAMDLETKPRNLGPITDPGADNTPANRGQIVAGQRSTVTYTTLT